MLILAALRVSRPNAGTCKLFCSFEVKGNKYNLLFGVQPKRRWPKTCDISYGSHTIDYFKSLKILKLCDLYHLKIVIKMYKCFNLNDYSFLNTFFLSYSYFHTHETLVGRMIRLLKNNGAKPQWSFVYPGINV